MASINNASNTYVASLEYFLDYSEFTDTCTCFYEQIDCARKTNFPDYIIGIYDVKKRGHFHNIICKTGYNPLAHCEKS
jgi:hypothetical protein